MLQAGTAPLEAGVARIDLTPPLETQAALGGYGARESRPATGIHDAVWAKALCLRQDNRRFALVTADVLAFPPKFKTAVLDRLAADGWTREQVLLLPSHTHTSLDMMALHPDNRFGIPQVGVFHQQVFDGTVDRLARVIRESAAQSTPIAVGSSQTPVPDRNRNRRAGNTAHDPDLTVTRIDTTAGTPLAVLVNWTAHPTFMDAEDMWFSGDWPGHLQRTLEAAIGGTVTVLFYNGAEGDQSPTPPAAGRSAWERAERYGRERGLEAWRAWQSIAPQSGVPFATHTTLIPLPPRQWHPDFMKTGGAEYGLNDAMMRGFVETLVPRETHSTAVRLGNLLMLGVPGELAAELGLAAKARARSITGAPIVAIGGLADEWVSYILSPAEYERGGYEASMCFYGPTLGTNIVAGLLRAAAALPPAPP